MKHSTQDYQTGALENLAQVETYNQWLVSKFEKYLGQQILEIGSGLGNITLKVKEKGFKIIPTDIDKTYLNSLKKINKNAFYLNITDANSNIINKFDTIIAINVLEHIKNDTKALRNIYGLLKPDGIFVILVPAHKILFGSYDKLAGHKRRYSKTAISQRLKKTGFDILQISYLNKISALGWFINARLLKRKGFPKMQLTFFKLLVPFLNFFDKIIPFDFGISIIGIAKKG